ncbi:hypothetical protein U1Q18_014242 [Sarracenia purpurea var. burkii]
MSRSRSRSFHCECNIEDDGEISGIRGSDGRDGLVEAAIEIMRCLDLIYDGVEECMGTVGEADTEEDENGGEGGEEADSKQGTVSSHPLATNGRNIEDEEGKDGSEEGESGDDNDEGSDVSDTVNEGKPEREISPAN